MQIKDFTDEIIAEKVKKIKALKELNQKTTYLNKNDTTKFDITATFRFNIVNSLQTINKKNTSTDQNKNFNTLPQAKNNYQIDYNLANKKSSNKLVILVLLLLTVSSISLIILIKFNEFKKFIDNFI